jgi:hypothetical protein
VAGVLMKEKFATLSTRPQPINLDKTILEVRYEQ